MKSCARCNVSHSKPGKFCSRSCANSRVWSEADKQKKSIAAKNSDAVKSSIAASNLIRHRWQKYGRTLHEFKCAECSSAFTDINRRRKYCGNGCAKVANAKRCRSPEERKRLRDIGRMGGFGEKGMTAGGVAYQSRLERSCFELLESEDIPFEPHKHIPNSSKISDIYIPLWDLWIEVDGIDRDKRKKWLASEYKYWQEKMQLYADLKLPMRVVKSVKQMQSLLAEYVG